MLANAGRILLMGDHPTSGGSFSPTCLSWSLESFILTTQLWAALPGTSRGQSLLYYSSCLFQLCLACSQGLWLHMDQNCFNPLGKELYHNVSGPIFQTLHTQPHWPLPGEVIIPTLTVSQCSGSTVTCYDPPSEPQSPYPSASTRDMG